MVYNFGSDTCILSRLHCRRTLSHYSFCNTLEFTGMVSNSVRFGQRTSHFSALYGETLVGLRDTVCVPYLDGILVYSGSFKDHVEYVRMVLKRLKRKGITLKPRKRSIFKNEARFLGCIVSEQGYHIDPAEASIIENMKQLNPRTETVGELRRVLGFAGYYISFIVDFARIAKPLYD